MQNKQSLIQEIELVNALKYVTQAYQEISVMRMQRIRSAVLKTREFLESLSVVFYDVKKSYDSYIKEMIKAKKGEDISLLTLLPKNGKSITIFISANEKMMGDITLKVFRNFLGEVQKNDTDVMIIGKIGRDMYKQSGIHKPIIYLEAADDVVKIEDIQRIAYYIVNYSKINVFYGKFESLVTQTPVKSNLSGENPFEGTIETADQSKQKQSNFLFEPNVEKIMQFFETQVFTSLFNQTFHESQLARHASRINAMEEALMNIEKTNVELSRRKKQLKRMKINRRQIETISGIGLWSN
jgi:ATP synthase F1 gamma subunit